MRLQKTTQLRIVCVHAVTIRYYVYAKLEKKLQKKIFEKIGKLKMNQF